jgi:hypothetical protein
MDKTPYRLDLNWQTRLALEWLTHDPDTAAYWRAVARANDTSAIAHELTTAMVEDVSALPASWARDAAMKSLQQIEWRELTQSLGAG